MKTKIHIKSKFYILLVIGIALLSIDTAFAQVPSAPQTNTANVTNGCNTSRKLSAYSTSPQSGLTHRS